MLVAGLIYINIAFFPDPLKNGTNKYPCANSGMTGQVGGFQNPGVCLQAFPSFLPHPLPALLLAPLFTRL